MGTTESLPSRDKLHEWTHLAASGHIDEVPNSTGQRDSLSALKAHHWKTTLECEAYARERAENADWLRRGLDPAGERKKLRRAKLRREKLNAKHAAKMAAAAAAKEKEAQETQQAATAAGDLLPPLPPGALPRGGAGAGPIRSVVGAGDSLLSSLSGGVDSLGGGGGSGGGGGGGSGGGAPPGWRAPWRETTPGTDCRAGPGYARSSDRARRRADAEASERAAAGAARAAARRARQVKTEGDAARQVGESQARWRRKAAANERAAASQAAAAAARRAEYARQSDVRARRGGALVRARAEAADEAALVWEEQKARQLARCGIALAVPGLALGEIAAGARPTGDPLDLARLPLRLEPTQEQRLVVITRIAQRRYPAVRDAIGAAHLPELAPLLYEVAELAAEAARKLNRSEGPGALQRFARAVPHQPDQLASTPRTYVRGLEACAQPPVGVTIVGGGGSGGGGGGGDGVAMAVKAEDTPDTAGAHDKRAKPPGRRTERFLRHLLAQARIAQEQLKHKICEGYPTRVRWDAGSALSPTALVAPWLCGGDGSGDGGGGGSNGSVVPFDPGVKSEERCRQKALAHFARGDFGRLADVARLSLEVRSVARRARLTSAFSSFDLLSTHSSTRFPLVAPLYLC